MKIACLIFWNNNIYDKLAEVAVKSFEYFNPDIKLYVVNNENIDEYSEEINTWFKHGPGVAKYAIGYKIFLKNKLDRLIMLGADTITLHPLSEFLDINNNQDILVTLDYKYPLFQNNIFCSSEDNHYNSDVVCFSNKNALLEVLRESVQFGRVRSDITKNTYSEQGGLNFVCNLKNDFTHKCIDDIDTKVCYNVKSKGREGCAPSLEKSTLVMNGTKVQTANGLDVKVFHYCCGLNYRNDYKQAIIEYNKMLGTEVCEYIEKITGVKLDV